jgi:hypothetical protein
MLYIILFYSHGGVRSCPWGSIICSGPIGHLCTDEWTWDSGGMVIDRRKLKYSEKNISQCHFIHHTSHTDYPRIEPRSVPWETSKTNHLSSDVILVLFTAAVVSNQMCQAVSYEGRKAPFSEFFGFYVIGGFLHPREVDSVWTGFWMIGVKKWHNISERDLWQYKCTAYVQDDESEIQHRCASTGYDRPAKTQDLCLF